MFKNRKFIFFLLALYIETSSSPSTWSLASIRKAPKTPVTPVTPVTTPIKDRGLQKLTEVESLLRKIDRQNGMCEILEREFMVLQAWLSSYTTDGATLTPDQEKQLEILIIKWIFRVLLAQVRQYMFHSTLLIDIKKYQLATDAYTAALADLRIFTLKNQTMSQEELSQLRENLYTQSSNLSPTNALLFKRTLIDASTSSTVGTELKVAPIPLTPAAVQELKATTEEGFKQVDGVLYKLQQLGLSNPELTAKFRELIGLKDSFLANSNVTHEGANEIELKTIQLAMDILSQLGLTIIEGKGIADELILEFAKLVKDKVSGPEFMGAIKQERISIPQYFVPQTTENNEAIVIIKKTLTILFAKYGQEHIGGIRSKLIEFVSKILDEILSSRDTESTTADGLSRSSSISSISSNGSVGSVGSAAELPKMPSTIDAQPGASLTVAPKVHSRLN